MSLIEKQSIRKCKALKYLVTEGVYSPAYALEKLENLFDSGKVLENDYEELAEYLESLLIENEHIINKQPTLEEEIEQNNITTEDSETNE